MAEEGNFVKCIKRKYREILALAEVICKKRPKNDQKRPKNDQKRPKNDAKTKVSSRSFMDSFWFFII